MRTTLQANLHKGESFYFFCCEDNSTSKSDTKGNHSTSFAVRTTLQANLHKGESFYFFCCEDNSTSKSDTKGNHSASFLFTLL